MDHHQVVNAVAAAAQGIALEVEVAEIAGRETVQQIGVVAVVQHQIVGEVVLAPRQPR